MKNIYRKNKKPLKKHTSEIKDDHLSTSRILNSYGPPIFAKVLSFSILLFTDRLTLFKI